VKNFDNDWSARRAVENRTFQICGEQFVIKEAPRPESLDIDTNIGEESTLEGTMKALDDLLLSLIETEGNDAETRYRAIRERPVGGLGINDVRDIIDWAMELLTGRPPTSQNASSPGSTRTGTRSTGGSSLKAVSG
jgi:hypothetical protein